VNAYGRCAERSHEQADEPDATPQAHTPKRLRLSEALF
jgi:hypothetical protein